MCQARCPVEHARMQVGNAVGSQTPVNKHQSTTVNQPSHSPHLFPASSPSPIPPPPPPPHTHTHTHTPFALTKREHSKTQLLLVSRRIGSSVRVRIMLGSNPEHVTAEAYSHYYIKSSSPALCSNQTDSQDFQTGKMHKEIDRYILEKVHSKIPAKMKENA